MKTLDEILADKTIAILHFMLSKIIKPDIVVGNVTELDENQIKEIKQKYGVECVILDVDETLRKDMKNIPKVNKNWIEKIQEHIKIVVLSNGRDKKVEDYFNEIGIRYISCAHKPLKMNFLKVCKEMNVQPDKVLVVGDSLVDDVYGGKRNKMRTALVKDVEEEER